MRGERGSNKQPGEVRRSQNWIGGSRPGNAASVPPAPDKLPPLLGELERYIHTDEKLATPSLKLHKLCSYACNDISDFGLLLARLHIQPADPAQLAKCRATARSCAKSQDPRC
ncbi:hypothetical protein L4923_28475 [Mesorhizobium sp. IRAMC:0171]|uniref:Uncharacterized protein n=1 Tax=Mesorhizobium retamae TaxID=2912854 RepID=A0ABS9QQ52_9HYPH|nr:hypothetical protein [Mesorhizobium sp. IRAMC:0171]